MVVCEEEGLRWEGYRRWECLSWGMDGVGDSGEFVFRHSGE